jgi:hypothetical protein
MEECSICLEELLGEIVILKCTHKFHNDCIKIVKSGQCPLCRNKLVKIGKFKAYSNSASSIRYKINEPKCCNIL